MGIKLSLFDVQCGARILYYAQACETFAEYEMDYIIFAKKEVGQFQINPDEVDSYDFIKLRDLDDFILDKKLFLDNYGKKINLGLRNIIAKPKDMNGIIGFLL